MEDVEAGGQGGLEGAATGRVEAVTGAPAGGPGGAGDAAETRGAAGAGGAAVSPAAVGAALVRSVERVFWGKADVVKMAVACLLGRGHLLVEDVPGVGKTTLAKALARSAGGVFRRIQFTADLLPSDILGVTVFDPRTGAFVFKPGPIFANLVLADEINRATPRTQSALLEAMSEGQVSVDVDAGADFGLGWESDASVGATAGGAAGAASGGAAGAAADPGGRSAAESGVGATAGGRASGARWDGGRLPLPQPFMVIATQNPQEQYGTYPLPESQMDRFLLRVRVGYPDAQSEGRIIAQGWRSVDPERLSAVTRPETLRAVQAQVDAVRVAEPLVAYVMRVVWETRRQPGLALGISTRGAMAWVQAARAWAVLEGRSYVIPDDLKTLALPALAHRVVLVSQQESVGRERAECERLMGDILRRVPLPE